ncbi:hypothetical protein BK011_02880 [Tenericutes bacterium MZ-XQ]|jgi:uncharacterized membrane protein YhhN|nr:hypothetical protein BK011_02880 [Tenericutes bacterium MZ-XQ]
MIYVLIGLFLLMWSLFIYHVIKGKRLRGFYFKGFTSFMFITVFIYGIFYAETSVFPEPIILVLNVTELRLILFMGLGLVLGLIGDLILEVQYFHEDHKNEQISFGMIAFGLGHIFYILALTNYYMFNPWALLIGGLMVGVVYFGSKLMKIDFKSLAIMSYMYTFVIFTMVGLSVLVYFSHYTQGALVFMIGAILFGVSDLLLAPIYFKAEKSKLFVVGNLSTYYLGQLFIALSIMFVLNIR